MIWERAALTAGLAGLVFWLAFDSGMLTAEGAPPGTSVALGLLGVVFGLGAFVMQKGGQPERVPLLAGLSAGAIGYALVHAVAF